MSSDPAEPEPPVTGLGVPVPDDPWQLLRGATRARVALGRAGDGLPTSRELEFRAAHAVARDAVHTPLDPDRVRAGLTRVGLARLLAGGRELLTVRSAAPDRATYLQRPDLGRRLAEGTVLPSPLDGAGPDLAIVVADGLSPRAVHEHAADAVAALVARLPEWSLGPLVLAEQARVALGDHVGAALGARAVVVLIGERPGLSSADSLGVYLTWAPRPGRADAERNCVSNVRPPHGLGYAAAADVVAGLLTAARALGASGVALKDEAPALDPAARA